MDSDAQRWNKELKLGRDKILTDIRTDRLSRCELEVKNTIRKI